MILLRKIRHRRVFTRVPLPLHTEMFLHRYFYMLIRLQFTVLYAHILLHANIFTQRHFDTQWQARLHANTFTRRCSFCARFLYTHALSEGCLWSYMLLHRDIFTRRHLCTERNAFLHTNTFTERWFYCEQFYTKTKTNRGAFTKECMCTKGF